MLSHPAVKAHFTLIERTKMLLKVYKNKFLQIERILIIMRFSLIQQKR